MRLLPLGPLSVSVASAAASLVIIAACARVRQDPAPAPAQPASDVVAVGDAGPTLSVVSHHNGETRLGTYVQPGLSFPAITSLHRDMAFDGSFTGKVNAQPLFVPDGARGRGTFYVVTEANDVLAFDEASGSLVWRKNFGLPADTLNLGCKIKFSPIGITGTPVIDTATRTLYVDSVQSAGDAGGPDAATRIASAHLIHGLSLDDGSERPGWPVDPTGLASNGHAFDPTMQHQRGALLIESGMLYVPYGSLGDCGDYHGWLVGIQLSDPTKRTAYSTPGVAAGIWAPNGVAAARGSLFVATGNSQDPAGAWAGGEAVLRFRAGVDLTSAPVDYFAPSNWHELDVADVDLGASGVILLEMPKSTPPHVALALGKDGFAYLLDQDHLGGIGDGGVEGLAKVQVATRNFATAPAAFVTSKGTFVVVDAQTSGVGINCPDGQSGDLIVLQIVDGAPPTIKTAWCAQNSGHGSPIVTTTDGLSNPIVWLTSDKAERIHAFDAETGDLLFDGGEDDQKITTPGRFNTVVAVHDRIFVAATDRLYAFGL